MSCFCLKRRKRQKVLKPSRTQLIKALVFAFVTHTSRYRKLTKMSFHEKRFWRGAKSWHWACLAIVVLSLEGLEFREKQKNYYLIVLFKQVVLTHFYFFGFISQLGWMKSFGFCFWQLKILNFERQVYKKVSNNERIIKKDRTSWINTPNQTDKSFSNQIKTNVKKSHFSSCNRDPKNCTILRSTILRLDCSLTS